jgi:hypothetical protein
MVVPNARTAFTHPNANRFPNHHFQLRDSHVVIDLDTATNNKCIVPSHESSRETTIIKNGVDLEKKLVELIESDISELLL